MASDEQSIFNRLVENDYRLPGGPELIKPGVPPLPAMLAPHGEDFPGKVANPGLWWERYGASMVKKLVANKFKISAQEWVTDLVVRRSGGPKPDVAQLQAHADRLKRIATAGTPGGLALDMTLTSRLVTGMGLPHPIENSLLFHPTLGCPYIPGSTIKGAVQAFADEWLGADERLGEGGYDDVPEDLRQVLTRIFGQASRRPSDQDTAIGSVIFFDAVPLSPPVLVPEVMTPHVGKYLTGPDDLPLETTNPVPIYFPAVDPGKGGGTQFRFCLRPSVRAQTNVEADGCASDVGLAAGWLVACLRDVGIGAKTKSGYGRFRLSAVHPPKRDGSAG